MKRNASAHWKGNIKEGNGTLTSESGILDETKYSFETRFGDEKGTNPEELIAAAHAGCFTMAVSNGISNAGGTVNELKTDCDISINPKKLEIASSHLKLEADIDGLDEDAIKKVIEDAKENCPVSKLLNAEISLDYNIK